MAGSGLRARAQRVVDELDLGIGGSDMDEYLVAIGEAEEEMRSVHALVGTKPGRAQRADRRSGTLAWPAGSPQDDPFNVFLTRCLVRGDAGGRLAGLRIGLKDNISVAGVPMTLGSHFMDGFVPDEDATVVTRLLRAGGDVVGKLNMDGFSSGGHGLGTGLGDYGPSLNPHDENRVSGGSSSGSAVAVAAGLVDLALGVDQGGSIRGPAAWCGVAGLKPTFGVVPGTGVVGADDLLDHVGPIARRARDLRGPLEVIAGPDLHDLRCTGIVEESHSGPLLHGPRGLRIGVVVEAFGDPEADPHVETLVRDAISTFERAGASVAQVSLPLHKQCVRLMATLLTLGMHGVVMNGGNGRGACPAQPGLAEDIAARVAAGHGALLPARTKLAILVGECLRQDARETYTRARWAATNYRREYQRVFERHDLLVMPTVPIKAPPRDGGPGTTLGKTLRRRYARVSTVNTATANITGNPAITVPCGPANELPVGLQLVGPWYSDRLLVEAATWFEESRRD